MRKRMSDTAAIVAEPVGQRNVSVSVRPIGNGYVVSECRNGPGDEYNHTETYYKEMPRIKAEVSGGSGRAAPNALSDAGAYLREND